MVIVPIVPTLFTYSFANKKTAFYAVWTVVINKGLERG
jgi:hypothetical protein